MADNGEKRAQGRGNINVSRDSTGTLSIEVILGDKRYNSSVKGDEHIVIAIDHLVEMIMKKEVGVTKHDFMMQVSDFFLSEDGK